MVVIQFTPSLDQEYIQHKINQMFITNLELEPGLTITGVPAGQQEFTTPGTYTWTAPTGVTSVCVVCVGGGGGGSVTEGGPGGGVGIYGQGANGAGGAGSGSSPGQGGSGGTTSVTSIGGVYGGGGRARVDVARPAGAGAGGAVRIIWGGGRFFPATNTADV